MTPETNKAEDKAKVPAAGTPAPQKQAPAPSTTVSQKSVVAEAPVKKLIYPRVVSRLVYIRRKRTGISLPVEGEFIDESIQKIGPAYRFKSVLRGLEPQEEERWLPRIIGVQPTSDNWGKATEDYWAHISRVVPPNNKDGSGGLELEIGMRYETEADFLADEQGKLDEDGALLNPKGNPINPTDYILWRYCLRYSKVANSYEEIHKSAKIEFYIFSKDKDIKDKKNAFELRKEANQLLYKNLSDRSWVEHMLRVLVQSDPEAQVGIKDIPRLDDNEKDVLLDQYASKMPASFLTYGKDRHLEMKSFIEVCVVVGLLNRIPNTQSISLDGQTLGNTTEEVVAFLLNPQNNGVLGQLKAQAALRP